MKFVYFAQQLLVSAIKQVAPNVRIINYVTDGRPSDFKNRYNILNLSFHEIDFGVRAIRTLTATSQGIGPINGLGMRSDPLLLGISCKMDQKKHSKALKNSMNFPKNVMNLRNLLSYYYVQNQRK